MTKIQVMKIATAIAQINEWLRDHEEDELAGILFIAMLPDGDGQVRVYGNFAGREPWVNLMSAIHERMTRDV